MDLRQVAIIGLGTMGAAAARGELAGTITAVVLSVRRAMHGASGDPAFAPVPLLAGHAAAGLGCRG